RSDGANLAVALTCADGGGAAAPKRDRSSSALNFTLSHRTVRAASPPDTIHQWIIPVPLHTTILHTFNLCRWTTRHTFASDIYNHLSLPPLPTPASASGGLCSTTHFATLSHFAGSHTR